MSILSVAVLGVLGLVVAVEGAICLIMAAPIAFPLGLLGGLVGYAIQARPWSLGETPYLLLFVGVLLPSLMAAESASEPEPTLVEVTTTVEIDAPPERVWQSVVSLPELPVCSPIWQRLSG